MSINWEDLEDLDFDDLWEGPIAIVGAGQLGSSLMEGLLYAGIEPSQIRVATRSPEHASRLEERFGVTACPAHEAVDGATLVAIAVRPGQVTGVLDEIAGHIHPDAAVISLAGAPTHDVLAAHLPDGMAIMRIMPNPPMAVGAGVIAWWTPKNFPGDLNHRLQLLFLNLGTIIETDEDRLGLMGSLTGHGQAVVYYAAEAMIQWGVLQGFSREEATTAVKEAIYGAAVSMADTPKPPSYWQNRLCTPGGTTIRTAIALDDRGVKGGIIAAMDGDNYRGR